MNVPEAVVVAVGEEVLRGEVVDTNSAWLGARLSGLGLRVRAGLTVADRETDIVEALRRAAGVAPLVVVTGGLGPTGDDLTAAAAARFAGVALVESPRVLEDVAARSGCRVEELSASRRRMAMVPEGAETCPNPKGSAPGIHLQVPGAGCQGPGPARHPTPDTRHLFLLPGVPHEMKAIFAASVAPAVERLFPDRPRRHARLLHLCGWPESRADAAAREALAGPLAAGEVELGTKLGGGWVSLRVAAEGDAGAEALEDAARRLAGRFGDSLWGEGPEASLAAAAAAELARRGLTLALAESCTGGLVASCLVAVPGVSGCLLEALVTYSNASKTRLLGVDEGLLGRHGAVSAECAEAMARGLRTRCGADITLAVTGIAGPEGGSPGKPVGTVHFAVCTTGGIDHDVQCFGGARDWVRQRAASHALWLIWRKARQTSDQ